MGILTCAKFALLKCPVKTKPNAKCMLGCWDAGEIMKPACSQSGAIILTSLFGQDCVSANDVIARRVLFCSMMAESVVIYVVTTKLLGLCLSWSSSRVRVCSFAFVISAGFILTPAICRHLLLIMNLEMSILY